jgi:hypothetical protein
MPQSSLYQQKPDSASSSDTQTIQETELSNGVKAEGSLDNASPLESNQEEADPTAYCAVNIDDISRSFVSHLDSESYFVEFSLKKI